MKKAYVKPSMESEAFIPSEYIAACWLIACDVDWGSGYYETNGMPGCQTQRTYKGEGSRWDPSNWVEADECFISDVSGCNTTHKGVNLPSAPTPNCYWVTGRDKPDEYNAFTWYQQVGHGHLPTHVSTLTDFETNPNAS